jgi:hypothetical protein
MHVPVPEKPLALLDEFKNFALKGNVIDLAGETPQHAHHRRAAARRRGLSGVKICCQRQGHSLRTVPRRDRELPHRGRRAVLLHCEIPRLGGAQQETGSRGTTQAIARRRTADRNSRPAQTGW